MAVERALFRAALPKWAKLGWSGARMVSEARRLAIPTFRRADMLLDIRRAKEMFYFAPKVRAFSAVEPISSSLMVQTKLRRPYKYRVYVDFIEIDPEIGVSVKRERSFYTDTLRSKQDYLDTEVEDMMGEDEYRGIEVFKAEVSVIEHNMGAGY